MIIDEIINEAINLQISIKKNKKRLDELKNILKENTLGKNISYKINTEKGIASFTKRKDKITYIFDEGKFLDLHEDNKLKLIRDGIVKEKMTYFIDLSKVKEYKDKDLVNSLMRENYKESYFTIRLTEK